MLTVARHYGGDPCVRMCGSCAIGVVNAHDMPDSTLSSDGDWLAAFSGKLDNTKEVACAVGEAGFHPASHSPADLMVAAFRAFGAGAPSRLRGVFAAIVTDGHDLWCFRDQLGWRPLHFRDLGDRFVVASEAKQVVVGAALPREPDLDVIEALFYGRLDNRTPATLKGVERVPQASVLSVASMGSPKLQRYWYPAAFVESSTIPAEETAEHFAEVFGAAVRRALILDGDVVSLSGGIDSPAVAGFAAPIFRELTRGPLHALSTVYPQFPRVDESRYIELVARYLGMELRTFTPKAGPWDSLPYWVEVFDGPIPTLSLDEITEYYRLARQLGYRNVLGGDVAEVAFNLHRHLIGHLVTRGRWKPLVTLARASLSQGMTWPQLAGYIASPFIPGRVSMWLLHRTGRDFPARIPDWLSAAKVNEVPFRKDLIPPGRDRWTGVQLRPYMGTTLTLEAGDVAARLCGVTSRSPFADVDVIQFFLGLRAEVKFPDLQSKTLVRRMLRGRVPDEILDRRDKTVFGDYMMSHIDYGVLRKYLVNPTVRIDGVNYPRLAERIERQDFTLIDYSWANDLVRIHAFLSQW